MDTSFHPFIHMFGAEVGCLKSDPKFVDTCSKKAQEVSHPKSMNLQWQLSWIPHDGAIMQNGQVKEKKTHLWLETIWSAWSEFIWKCSGQITTFSLIGPTEILGFFPTNLEFGIILVCWVPNVAIRDSAV